ncbi:uncharacterized protein PGTG_11411 [Puccinia graminis f. sp. tritici CRL 75-36-700-3]|uniref:Uncharacterized protein n=1 Tax=Puccinia graminis f. sp. tritici (strain CRL 75-36-700-3 / race SCCL) TaxID=418459 RepID=E3KLP3_PUCGT|nr:uncharacterized protein PGTG_11411 [Puccinia graminis f. sp. tritici CRL 75-36-700-3]EFP85242.1 hypothetical protein PGTG_11411 [Puccinia graminis f. sp. tritici CRL 75-36-700-3]
MDPRMLLEMYMSMAGARNTAQAAPSEGNQSRRRGRRSSNSRRRAPAPAPAPAPAAAQPAQPVVPNPLLGDGRPQGIKLPFVDSEAKAQAHQDLRSQALCLPTAHPAGARHPRVYTLIGRGNLGGSPQRGTPPRPAESSPEVDPQTDGLPAQIIPAPAPVSQVGPSRRERTQGRTDPYAGSRANRARGPAAPGN